MKEITEQREQRRWRKSLRKQPFTFLTQMSKASDHMCIISLPTPPITQPPSSVTTPPLEQPREDSFGYLEVHPNEPKLITACLKYQICGFHPTTCHEYPHWQTRKAQRDSQELFENSLWLPGTSTSQSTTKLPSQHHPLMPARTRSKVSDGNTDSQPVKQPELAPISNLGQEPTVRQIRKRTARDLEAAETLIQLPKKRINVQSKVCQETFSTSSGLMIVETNIQQPKSVDLQTESVPKEQEVVKKEPLWEEPLAPKLTMSDPNATKTLQQPKSARRRYSSLKTTDVLTRIECDDCHKICDVIIIVEGLSREFRCRECIHKQKWGNMDYC
ncbi:hypothetical protein EDC01DRAFT_638486 [Geopyxis carbonaria]|nr:hypothetical protein EDC01DRAFT_638486 [Geopyxis carbonaria]